MAGRPREFDSDAALETILGAFWRDGFDAITIAQLVRETGVTASSLYAAFGDKHAMFDLAAARYIERLDRALRRDLGAATAREAIANVLRSAADNFARTDQPLGCLVMAEPLLAERRQVTRTAIRDRLRAGHQAGEFTDDPDTLGDYINVVLAGLAAHAREGATRDALARVVRRTVAALPPAPRRSARPTPIRSSPRVR